MPGTSALWEAETGNHKDLLTLVCLQVKQETLSQRNKVKDDAVRHRHYPLASIHIYTHIHEPYTFATHMHVLIKIKSQHFPHPIPSSNPSCVISLSLSSRSFLNPTSSLSTSWSFFLLLLLSYQGMTVEINGYKYC